MNKLAQIDFGPGTGGGYTGFGKLGNPAGSNGITIFGSFISSTIGLLTLVGIIWFVFVLITGAIAMISAGSDKGAMENARKKVINGAIGLVVLIAGIFIIDLFGTIIGIPDILNVGTMFNKLQGLESMN